MQTYRNLFLHPTKTGGTSIINVLDLKKNHKPLHNKMGRGFFKFASVRNPYDRVVSLFYFLKHYETSSFDIFLEELKFLKNQINYLPQNLYTHIGGKKYVDEIIYFEEIEENFFKIFNKKLIHSNKNYVGKRLVPNLSQKEKIFEIYKNDFLLLGYKK